MTPAQAIAMLDDQLARHGQTVVVRKTGAATPSVSVKAFVRGYKPNEIAGTITQADKKVTLSPTGLSDWLPADKGQVVFDGRPRTIQGEPEFIKLSDTLVRINLTVRG
jgi:hypothetical protein